MYERFTDRARKVMMLANIETQRFGNEYIDTEHILLGLINEREGLAAAVLKDFNVDVVRVIMEIEEIVESKPQLANTNSHPTTLRTKQVIESAIEECRLLKHQYVGTEHLLLGLLREEDGVAAQVLQNLGLERQAIRDEVLAILGHGLDTNGQSTDAISSEALSETSKIVLQLIPLIPLQERQFVVKRILEELGGIGNT